MKFDVMNAINKWINRLFRPAKALVRTGRDKPIVLNLDHVQTISLSDN